jgi:hypothetical protein
LLVAMGKWSLAPIGATGPCMTMVPWNQGTNSSGAAGSARSLGANSDTVTCGIGPFNPLINDPPWNQAFANPNATCHIALTGNLEHVKLG